MIIKLISKIYLQHTLRDSYVPRYKISGIRSVFNLRSSLSLTYEESAPRRNDFRQQPATDHIAAAWQEVLQRAGAVQAHTRLRTQQCETSSRSFMRCSQTVNTDCQCNTGNIISISSCKYGNAFAYRQ